MSRPPTLQFRSTASETADGPEQRDGRSRVSPDTECADRSGSRPVGPAE